MILTPNDFYDAPLFLIFFFFFNRRPHQQPGALARLRPLPAVPGLGANRAFGRGSGTVDWPTGEQ
jgi:hypothetical protein